jgi:WD40 repeat protein
MAGWWTRRDFLAALGLAAAGSATPVRGVGETLSAGPSVPAPRVDAYGDPLPEGVRARLGSSRLRQSGRVLGLGYSPDGKILASGQWGHINLWDAATGKRLHQFDVPYGRFFGLDFSADGSTLTAVAGGATAERRVWELATRREISRSEFKGPPPAKYIAPIAMTADRIAMGRGDRAVWLYEASTGKQVLRIPVGGEEIEEVAFAPSGEVVAIANSMKSIRLHDAATGKVTKEFGQPGAKFVGVAFSPNGRWLATVSEEKKAATLVIWDPAAGTEQGRLTYPTRFTISRVYISFSRDSRLLASGVKTSSFGRSQRPKKSAASRCSLPSNWRSRLPVRHWPRPS